MMQQQSQSTSFLPEEDMLYTILCDLKRTSGEYATAVTESNCDSIRRMFQDLLNSSLHMQGHLYSYMKQNNMYNASSPALAQEINKQIQQYRQTEQQTAQFVQQKQSKQQSQMPAYSGMMSNQPSAQSQTYMSSMNAGSTNAFQPSYMASANHNSSSGRNSGFMANANSSSQSHTSTPSYMQNSGSSSNASRTPTYM